MFENKQEKELKWKNKEMISKNNEEKRRGYG